MTGGEPNWPRHSRTLAIVHYSVFECLLDILHFDKMLVKIGELVDEEDDSVRIYTLCANCEKAVKIIGTGELTENKDVYIV